MTDREQVRDVIDILVHDHREVEEMFSRLDSLAGGTSEEAKTVAEQMVIELVRHSVAEEEYLYPLVREKVPDGGAMADREIAEHAEAEHTMKHLESLDVDDEQFWPTVHKLMGEIRQHVAEEEGELFPKLRQVCSRGELEALGEKVQLVKKIAPTRPHPSAPDTPPANKLLAPGTGLVDRVRDMVTGRGKS